MAPPRRKRPPRHKKKKRTSQRAAAPDRTPQVKASCWRELPGIDWAKARQRFGDAAQSFRFLLASIVGLGALASVSVWLFGGIVGVGASFFGLFALAGFIALSQPLIPSAKHAALLAGVVFLLLSIALGFGSWLDGADVRELQGQIRTLEEERDEAKKTLAQYEIAEPVYAHVPKDIDLLVRGFGISIEPRRSQAAKVWLPKGGFLELEFSPLQRRGAAWFTDVHVNAADERRNVNTGKAISLKIKEGTLSEPFGLGQYEFYVHVDNEKVGDDGLGEVELSIARRPVFLLDISSTIMQGGSFKYEGIERPDFIMTARPGFVLTQTCGPNSSDPCTPTDPPR